MISRRAVIAGAGIGVISTTVKAGTAGGVLANEYTAKKGDVSLAMYRKRDAGSKEPQPVMFLVHGSSLSARTSYDLTVPGGKNYSMMNVFAGFGFDVWTMDHENYGKSSRTKSNSDIASGAEDLKTGIELIQRETGQKRVHLFGESSGGLRAGVYAMAHPENVDRLVLAAFTYKGEGSPTLAKRAEQLDYYRTHNTRLRDREMIHSIYTRDKAGTTDPAVADAVADVELKFGDQVPTGTYLDMTANLPVVDPARVKSPALLLRGEYDGIATMDDLTQFFNKLPNGDKQFIVLPGAAHSLITNVNRAQTMHVVRAFLTMPRGVVIS
jgi:pimeloyl-ACP methyl ester carboxylesterase